MPSFTHRTEAAALEQLGAPRSSGGRGGQQAGGREEACLSPTCRPDDSFDVAVLCPYLEDESEEWPASERMYVKCTAQCWTKRVLKK